MLLEANIQKILNELVSGKLIKLAMYGSDIVMRFLDDASKIHVAASVYNGSNYIPKSVRGCLSHKSPTPYSSIRTFLTLEEESFQINLVYLGRAEELSKDRLKDLIEEFAQIAENWRFYLDEHDKHDLVHVWVKN